MTHLHGVRHVVVIVVVINLGEKVLTQLENNSQRGKRLLSRCRTHSYANSSQMNQLYVV